MTLTEYYCSYGC